MTELDSVADLRFEGMEVPELCRWIAEIKAGPGPESMRNAARVMDECAQVVVALDETLRRELGKVHVEWEGPAASLASAANPHQTDVLRASEESLTTSAGGVRAQSDEFSQVRDGLPDPAELRPAQGASLDEWSGGLFGYEQDYDAEAKQLDRRKKAARAALSAYRDSTLSHAESYQRLPEMRPASVTAQSVGSTDGVAQPGTDPFGGVRFAGTLGPVGAANSDVDRTVDPSEDGAALAGVGAGFAGTLLGGEVGPETSVRGSESNAATVRVAGVEPDEEHEHDEYVVDDAWIADQRTVGPMPPDAGHPVDAGARHDSDHRADPDDGKQC